MKKSWVIAVAVLLGVSCNHGGSAGPANGSDSTGTGQKAAGDSTGTMATTGMPEGTMMMKGGKMMVMKAGAWTEMLQVMMCSDSCRVMPDGRVIMKDGEKMTLKEGERIAPDGTMMDAGGKMMDMKMGVGKGMTDTAGKMSDSANRMMDQATDRARDAARQTK